MLRKYVFRQCIRNNYKFDSHLVANIPREIVQWTKCQEEIFSNFFSSKNFPDILLQSNTGSGKTLAYLLPAIHKQLEDEEKGKLLIIVPTRELAIQIGQVVDLLIKNLDRSGSVLCGNQIPNNWDTSDIIVATPGALLRGLSTTSLPSRIATIVMDEFDRLFDFGFIPQIEEILSSSKNCSANIILVSATVPREVQMIANRLLRPGAWKLINTNSPILPKNISHKLMIYSPKYFYQNFWKLINDKKQSKGMVIFPTTKSLLFFYAVTNGRATSGGTTSDQKFLALHGRMGHEKRMSIASKYRQHSNCILFTTDLFARGLDVPDTEFVVNIGMSGVDDAVEQYIHRSGRTGRNSSTIGESILMVGDQLDSSSPNMRKIKDIVGNFTTTLDDSNMEQDGLPGRLCPIDPIHPSYKYIRHLSTKCLESLLLWHMERRANGMDRTVLAKSVIDMVRSAGVPQPYVSSTVAKKLRLDTVPGLLVIHK